MPDFESVVVLKCKVKDYFGIPVLTTDVGGTRELVNDKTGILKKRFR